MNSFLEQLADHLVKKYIDSLDTICIVLPNRRSRLFLQKFISAKINKPVWAPQILSIEEFSEKISGVRTIENLALYLDFYAVHKSIKGDKVETFDEFMKWGQTLLSDFNEIDLYLVEPELIYNYLTEAKALKVWNLEQKPLTDYEKDYIKFYTLFATYYSLLKQKLLNKNEAYQGLTYRIAVEKINDAEFILNFNKFIFAGFNALNTAEEKIIDTLWLKGKAELIWDADKYYVERPEQEAGKFIRKYSHKWQTGPIQWMDEYYLNIPKNITVIGVPQQIGQAKTAGQILSTEIKSIDLYGNTAVVLADENLLIPVLNSIPESISNFNVTMGISLKNFPFYTLADSIFSLHENALRLNKIQGMKEFSFYYKDILKIIFHPYFINLFNHYAADEKKFMDSFKTSNKSFYSRNELIDLLPVTNVVIKNIVEKIVDVRLQSSANIAECLLDLIHILQNIYIEQSATPKKAKQKNELEQEYLIEFGKILNQLNFYVKEYSQLFEIKTLRSVFSQLVATTQLPFRGEPLKGLQIMGVLETRNLDFENIIMLSVNEGILPSDKNSNSFIPYDIRKEFNLPTYKDRDSIYAYHFYRLLQRASNVFLIYNTQNDDFGSGEKSRFIQQMMNEMPSYNPQLKIQRKIVNIPVLKSKDVFKIEIEKNKDILEKLVKRGEKGFSASTLNIYINCPLQFYFQTVAGIKELDEAEDIMEPTTMGSIVHEILFKLYFPFLNKNLTAPDIKKMLTQVDTAAIDALKNNYSDGDTRFGKNYLILTVIKKFIVSYLTKELEHIESLTKQGVQLIIKNLEYKIETDFIVDTSKIIQLKLKGIIDRIDETGSVIRIVDYKTGKTDKKELKITDWTLLTADTSFSKSFQLLMYVYMYCKNNTYLSQDVEAGIISFRNLSQGFMKINFVEPLTVKDIITQFEKSLKHLLEEIFDPDKPFKQTENNEHCKYCPFISVCNR